MGVLVRLRISLADHPGALAQVATVIAGHGGSITSVDVQRSDRRATVDDVVVDFSGEPDLSGLRRDLSDQASATVMSHQETQAADPVVGCLRRVVDLVDSGLGDPATALAEGVAELCASPVVWVSTAEEAVAYEPGRIALEHNTAVALHTTELPGHLAELLPGEVCVLAVPDPERLTGGRVVFVARAVAADFTATEIARIEALTALHSRIERLVDSNLPGIGRRSAGGDSAGHRAGGDRPAGDRPAGDRPAGDRPAGDRPAGDRPAGDHGSGGPRAAPGDRDRSGPSAARDGSR